MNIELHMERLVLDGVDLPSGQHRLLQQAVEAELSRLLTEGGLAPALARGGQVPALPGAAIALQAGGADPLRLGRQIARSVYSGMAPP